MHEYPLTLQIIKTAEEYAKEHGASRVTAIHLVVGDYSGYVADSIALYFDLIAADSLCADAILDIERVQPLLKCKSCGGMFERKPFAFSCPKEDCEGEGEPTEVGREFFICSIEIEREE